MFRIKILYLFSLVLLFNITVCCGNNEKDNDIILNQDTENPTINCIASINVAIDTNENGAIVTYDAPVGTDNLPGVETIQTNGLPSGDMFPIGTTTNTFVSTDAAGNSTSCSFDVTVVKNTPSAEDPYFVAGNNPLPSGKKWVKVEELSDEFNVDTFDEVKWKNTDPSSWIGRAPGLFKKNTVSQADGNLRLTTNMLSEPEIVNGKTFTHAGSNISSNAAAEVGYYFECRMKANKTFMSSTFWAINNRRDETGCDVRVTELDIQECVGQVTTTATWAQSFNQRMNSNTHSRNTSCPETVIGSIGQQKDLSSKVSDDYHVYAAWWKSPTEIQYFLDGKKVATVTPKADFSLKMYVKMVVETYDWNPVPADGGMTGSFEDRTTYYDWVRTWKLENQ